MIHLGHRSDSPSQRHHTHANHHAPPRPDLATLRTIHRQIADIQRYLHASMAPPASKQNAAILNTGHDDAAPLANSTPLATPAVDPAAASKNAASDPAHGSVTTDNGAASATADTRPLLPADKCPTGCLQRIFMGGTRADQESLIRDYREEESNIIAQALERDRQAQAAAQDLLRAEHDASIRAAEDDVAREHRHLLDTQRRIDEATAAAEALLAELSSNRHRHQQITAAHAAALRRVTDLRQSPHPNRRLCIHHRRRPTSRQRSLHGHACSIASLYNCWPRSTSPCLRRRATGPDDRHLVGVPPPSPGRRMGSPIQ